MSKVQAYTLRIVKRDGRYYGRTENIARATLTIRSTDGYVEPVDINTEAGQEYLNDALEVLGRALLDDKDETI